MAMLSVWSYTTEQEAHHGCALEHAREMSTKVTCVSESSASKLSTRRQVSIGGVAAEDSSDLEVFTSWHTTRQLNSWFSAGVLVFDYIFAPCLLLSGQCGEHAFAQWRRSKSCPCVFFALDLNSAHDGRDVCGWIPSS